MTFKLSNKSLSRLEGVDPKLVAVVKRAIEISDVDFTVTEGLRPLATQRLYVKQGRSQTLNSKHLKGLAVDLAAYINGTISWDFDYYFKIADVMREAAIELNVRVKWGGAWRYLNDYPNSKAAYNEYIAERKRFGKKPFLDGVHFEV